MKPLLEVKDLDVHFPIKGGLLRREVGKVYVVNNISLQIMPGECFGIVGESGCGKTTLGRAIVGINRATQGKIFFEGKEVDPKQTESYHEFRRQVQMVFQDPYASLNPRKPILSILEEPFLLNGIRGKSERLQKVKELLECVGLGSADLHKYPHEFSGGQRQRIGIARALALRPKLIVCDEAVSALDVSIQAQIINLLVDLQKRFQLAYIFISHDLNVVRYLSDRMAVMYLGRLMEMGSAHQIYQKPLHPYTKALLQASPSHDPKHRGQLSLLEGEVPSPSRPPSGCPFQTRCPYVQQVCKEKIPELKQKEARLVACHLDFEQ